MFLQQRVGFKKDINIKRTFFLSKILTNHPILVPSCKRIRIVFPFYESESLLRTKGIMVLLEFLEQISGLRSIINKANMIVGSGLWVRGQVDLSGFPFMQFFSFFNEYILCHPLLRSSSRLPLLSFLSRNSLKLVISDIDFFFDASTRRQLPSTKHYWLEISFFFKNRFTLKKEKNIIFYTQFFFSTHLIECRNL